jgi:general secretion pathway protein G
MQRITFIRLKRPHGFTLLEMLVVLAIIGLLAGLIGPRMFGKVDEAGVTTAEAQVKMLRSAIETFKFSVGRYPTAQEGLAVLNKPPADAPSAARWRGPYLDGETPVDPWKNPYVYSLPGANGQPFALYSLGSDGKRGGEGTAADIGMLPPAP